jgi:hypothetical protein
LKEKINEELSKQEETMALELKVKRDEARKSIKRKSTVEPIPEDEEYDYDKDEDMDQQDVKDKLARGVRDAMRRVKFED